MAIFLHYDDFKVEAFEDSAFVRSVDSPTSYDKVIQTEEDKPFSPNSKHAIKVYKDDTVIKTAILLASGGGTFRTTNV